MFFKNSLFLTKQIGRQIEKFLYLTGKTSWLKVTDKIETTKGYYYKIYLYKRNPLARAVNKYIYLSKKGQSIWKNFHDEDIQLLGSTALLYIYLFEILDEKGKNILAGRIKEDDTRSLLFEFKLITHFLQNDAQIEFVDYNNIAENKQKYDFNIRMKSREFEVECKYKDYDSKRKLTRPALYLLSDLILNEIEIKKFNCILSFEFKDSISKNHHKQKEYVKLISNKLESENWQKMENEDFNLEIIPVNFTYPLDTYEKMLAFVHPYYLENCHFSFLCSNSNNFILRFLTLGKENLVDGIYESIKKATTQFSQEKAAIIPCHIEGIYPEEWNQLKDEGGLFNMTKYFLSKEKNNFIHSVIYSSTPGSILDNKVYEMKTHYLTFKNPNTLFYKSLNTKDLIND